MNFREGISTVKQVGETKYRVYVFFYDTDNPIPTMISRSNKKDCENAASIHYPNTIFVDPKTFDDHVEMELGQREERLSDDDIDSILSAAEQELDRIDKETIEILEGYNNK